MNNFESNTSGKDGVLNKMAATTFLAISAKTKYLAQDRAHGNYNSKELCRDVATPNDNSLNT